MLALPIETLEITLADGVASGSANLTLGQTLANCVPFQSMRMDGVSPDWGYAQIGLDFATAPDRVVATRSTTLGAVTVRIPVVAFDPAKIRVQKIPYAFGSGESAHSEAIPVPVASLSKAFAIASSVSGGSNEYPLGVNSVEIPAVGQLLFSRGDVFAPRPSGNCWVIESLDDSFSVQTFSDADLTLIPVDMAKTFLAATHYSTLDLDRQPNRSPQVYLSSPSAVAMVLNAGGTRPLRGFAVTFGSSSNGLVLRGHLSFASGDDTEPAILSTPLDLDRSMALSPLPLFGADCASSDTTQQSRAHATLSLTGPAALEGTMGSTLAVASDYAWEATQWPSGGSSLAPTLLGCTF